MGDLYHGEYPVDMTPAEAQREVKHTTAEQQRLSERIEAEEARVMNAISNIDWSPDARGPHQAPPGTLGKGPTSGTAIQRATTQPATSQEGKRFKSWSTDTLADQCRMQARDQLDPELSSFLAEVADRLAATPTPPTLSDDLREAVERVMRRVTEWDALQGHEPRDRFAAFGENLRHDAMTLAALAQVKAS